MAMLQAARARALGLPEHSAHSWGLNRAIFIAAAKQGFRAGGESGGEGGAEASKHPERVLYALGDDEAIRDPGSSELLFTIGGETQDEARFQKQVAARFGSPANFHQAWEESMGIVRGFDEATLKSRREFYDQVYRPRRDELAAKWTEEYVPAAAARSPAKSKRA